MKMHFNFLVFGFILVFGLLSCQSRTTLTTVPSVDLKRYAGTWYEIASYPQFFERGCTNVKATYTPKDGYIEVYNQSVKNGKPNDIKGKAFVVSNAESAKLKVQFFWPFKADYWIIDLANDYSWAVVSDPKRSTLWILSRSSKMNENIYNNLIDKLVKNEFKKEKIIKMSQE